MIYSDYVSDGLGCPMQLQQVCKALPTGSDKIVNDTTSIAASSLRKFNMRLTFDSSELQSQEPQGLLTITIQPSSMSLRCHLLCSIESSLAPSLHLSLDLSWTRRARTVAAIRPFSVEDLTARMFALLLIYLCGLH